MPSKTVVTIAMTDGAHADEIAREVANRLGYRYINNEVIDEAAKQAGVDSQAVAAVEHKEPLVARILRGLTHLQAGEFGDYSGVTLDPTPGYRSLIRDVVHSIANEGNVVIGAHAASITLAGMPGLLRVLITAPIETRTTRLALEKGIIGTEARKIVDTTDRDRKDYFDKFFHLAAELPTHYDLVINTEHMKVDDAARLIVAAAE